MKQQIQLAISLPPNSSLRPIMPNQYDRFSPRRANEDPGPCDSPSKGFQTPIRGCESEFDCLPQSLPLQKSIHPEGGLVHSYKHLVSDCPISFSLRGIGERIVHRCSTMGRRDVTVFLRREGANIEYYVADHSGETILWINDQRPDSLQGLTKSRAGGMLCEEYWAHMEAFPGVRPVGAKSLCRLKDVLSSLAIDALTSDGSTSPFGYEQIQSFLGLLSSFSENHIHEHQTYAVARIWNMIWLARVINDFGSRDARLNWFIPLSNSQVKFTGLNSMLALCTLGAADKHLARCSRAWAGRIAYVIEWRRFKSKNEAEWTLIIGISCILVIASLLLSIGRSSNIVTIAPVLVSLWATTSAHYLLTESQNTGDHGLDAYAYFEKWEIPEYNVQRIALRNSIPQASLLWAFIVFVWSISRVFLT